jgi:hypothetical protein
VQDQSDDDDCSVIDMTKDDDDDCSVIDMTAETDEIEDNQKPRQNPNKPESSSADSDRTKQILAVYAMMDQIYGMLNSEKTTNQEIGYIKDKLTTILSASKEKQKEKLILPIRLTKNKGRNPSSKRGLVGVEMQAKQERKKAKVEKTL